MRRRAAAAAATLAGAAALAAAVAARAHVAPSMNDDNRYVKLTPMGDRVRLAYTVYFGEVPGAATRRQIDADHDGAISDAEAAAFGKALGAQVAPALDVRVDGAATPVAWAQIDVGMGQPVTAAGSFSVDLIAWLCLPEAGGAHTVVLKDRFAVPRPGENELRVEDTPGVHIDGARLGMIDLVDLDARWQGAGGPITTDGATLTFTAGAKAPVLRDGACAATAARGGGRGRVAIGLAIAGAVIAAGAAGAVLARRRRRGRARG